MAFTFTNPLALRSTRPRNTNTRRVCPRASSKQQVLVVGAGVIGLTTAIRLRDAGYVVSIVALETPSTILSMSPGSEPKNIYTSSGSGGYWMPFSATGAHLERWCLETLQVLRSEAESGVPGVTMHEGFILHYESMPETNALPFYAEASGMVRVTSKDDARVPSSYAGALRMTVPICRMDDYMPYLERRAIEGGCDLQRITEPMDIKDASVLAKKKFGNTGVVVNCTGIGARSFSSDDTVTPGRGVTVRVRKPKNAPNHFITETPEDGLLTKSGLLAYCLPRGDEYTLGGTLFEGNWDTTATKREADELVARCASLLPGVDRWERTSVWSGLRPLRKDGMRVDTGESIEGVPVINNYGHGGSGVTASWGCATDVVNFVNTM